MIRINKESSLYPVIADTFATFIGGCASVLVGGFCNGVISNSTSVFKKSCMSLGKFGLETITIYTVAPKMREEIDDLVDQYNKFADMVEVYNDQKAVENSGEEA